MNCAVCGKPEYLCPYNGDCAEMEYIYRESQREKLRDIDPEEIEEE